jgi:hypothetical protein
MVGNGVSVKIAAFSSIKLGRAEFLDFLVRELVGLGPLVCARMRASARLLESTPRSSNW